MKKKVQLLLFVLLFGVFVLPLSVFAEDPPKELVYETTITNWRPHNHLNITESSTFPVDTVVTWELDCDGDTIPLTKATGEVFANVDDTCTSATFREVVNFDGITLSELGLITNNTITPSVFNQSLSENASLSSGVQNYIFSSYVTTDYYPVHYYVLNTVDEYGNITGNPYIRDIYFSDPSEQKITTESLGSVNLPNYAVHYSYLVKGNIANPNGSFFLTHSDPAVLDITYPYSSSGEGTKIEFNSLAKLNTIDADPNSFVTAEYGVGAADSNYTITVANAYDGESFGDRLQVEENTFFLEYVITATFNADNSDTGLFYNLVPFVILIVLLGVFGFFFFHKKKKGKQVLVDDEVL